MINDAYLISLRKKNIASFLGFCILQWLKNIPRKGNKTCCGPFHTDIYDSSLRLFSICSGQLRRETMFRFIVFSSIGPIVLFLLSSGYGMSTPSVLTYKDCGFGASVPIDRYLVKAEEFKKKYGDKAKVEWITESNCQGVTLHYIP